MTAALPAQIITLPLASRLALGSDFAAFAAAAASAGVSGPSTTTSSTA
jgi:hypothetical protein